MSKGHSTLLDSLLDSNRLYSAVMGTYLSLLGSDQEFAGHSTQVESRE